MNTIINVNEKIFSLNGIEYIKTYISNVSVSQIKIINAYDSCNVLLDWTNYAEISVNGVVYNSISLLQSNLIDVCFNKSVSGNTAITNINEIPTRNYNDLQNKPSIHRQIIYFTYLFISNNNPYYSFKQIDLNISYFNGNTNQTNPELLELNYISNIGTINYDNAIIDKICFHSYTVEGTPSNVDIALFKKDIYTGNNKVLIYNPTNLEGNVNLENLDIAVEKNKGIHLFFKINDVNNGYNVFITGFTIYIK